jgi:phosphatidylglycerophosphate synthase
LTDTLSEVTLAFASEASANFPVAGIPAAARAAAVLARSGTRRCTIAVAGGWAPSDWCRAEWSRLARGLTITAADLTQLAPETLQRGEDFVSDVPGQEAPYRPNAVAEAMADLRRASRDILRATGKLGDGVVSRYFNRPISRAISARALRMRGFTPFHATLGTAALGLAMATALFLGGSAGMFAGAVLYQSASIFDGVDGEIARATWRASASGAKLDSLVDAATNLAFVLGLGFNLWQQGDVVSGWAGLCGFAALGCGFFLVGQMAQRKGVDFTFDAMKSELGQERSRAMRTLTYFAMRDFYAAAAAIMVIFGLAGELLVVFALVAAAWLLLVIWTRLRSTPA